MFLCGIRARAEHVCVNPIRVGEVIRVGRPPPQPGGHSDDRFLLHPRKVKSGVWRALHKLWSTPQATCWHGRLVVVNVG